MWITKNTTVQNTTECINTNNCKQEVHWDASIREQWGYQAAPSGGTSENWHKYQVNYFTFRLTEICYTCFSTVRTICYQADLCQKCQNLVRETASIQQMSKSVPTRARRSTDIPCMLYPKLQTQSLQSNRRRRGLIIVSYSVCPSSYVAVQTSRHAIQTASVLLLDTWSSVTSLSLSLSPSCLGSVQSDCCLKWLDTCSSLSGVFTLSVRTMHVGRWWLSITTSCCFSNFRSSIWDFRSEFSISSRSDS